MNKAIELSPELTEYILASSEDLGPVAPRVIAETMRMPESSMQISPDEAIFLRAMVRLLQPMRILEVGTFTGLSSLVMAGVLPEGGRVTCLDISDEYTTKAREAWRAAGVSNRIELIIGPALETLATLEGPYDLAFVDADKENLRAYVEAIGPMLEPGAVLMVDNTLWRQKVIGPESDHNIAAVREFNGWFVEHPDFDVEMLALADGVTLGIKR